MNSVADVGGRVAQRYRELDLPPWPDPHPGMSSPADEEYSRVTDGGRYRIVQERSRLWAAELGAVPGVTAAPLAESDVEPDPHRIFVSGTRLTSERAGTLPLYLLELDVRLTEEEGSLPVLRIGVGRPEIVVQSLPDCGCDACDSGSEDLLTTIDETVARIVGGPFVVLRGPGWQAVWSPDGSSVGGTPGAPDFHDITERCRRLAGGETVELPPGTEAFVGRAWFG